MKFTTLFVLTLIIGLLAAETRADEPVGPVEIGGVSARDLAEIGVSGQYRARLVRVSRDVSQARSFELDQDYALGVSRFDVDTHTEIIGWRLSNSLYFGAQDGEDSGLSFVWQKDVNQVSLSKDGLRLTRRF